jgi:hypothetical protein
MFVIVTADVHPRLTARLAFVVHQGSGALFAFGGEGSEEDVEMHGCARGRVGEICGRGKVR